MDSDSYSAHLAGAGSPALGRSLRGPPYRRQKSAGSVYNGAENQAEGAFPAMLQPGPRLAAVLHGPTNLKMTSELTHTQEGHCSLTPLKLYAHTQR